MELTKICTVCREQKQLDAFYNYKASKDGKQYRCKVCDNAAGTAYREANREAKTLSQKKANLKIRYGLSLEDYNELFKSQGHCCAICSKTGDRVRWVVDHDHDTGKVRGILCNSCNRGLGYFGDNPHTIAFACDYLLDKTEIH